MCECKELNNAIKIGVENMKREGALSFVIADYLHDMRNGEWIGCQRCKQYRREENE